MHRAIDIIRALDNYKRDHSRFPRHLGELAPTYLWQISKTTTGHDFIYEPHDFQGYYLCFAQERRQAFGCCYNHRLEGWDCSPGH